MQALREAEEANLELSGAQRLSWAAFGWSRALESTATGTMLSARRSRFFASASRREEPLLRREERRRTTVAFSAQPSNPARTHTFPFGKRVEKLSSKMQALREAEEANLELSGAQRLSWAAFAFDKVAVAHRSRRGQSGAVRSSAPVVGGFRLEPRFGEHCYRHNAQCAKKPLLRLR
ncbi:unnamed protein product [Coccothraustes coccothraustes]